MKGLDADVVIGVGEKVDHPSPIGKNHNACRLRGGGLGAGSVANVIDRNDGVIGGGRACVSSPKTH